MAVAESVAALAADAQPELVRLRRQLHEDPELGLSLPRTQELVPAGTFVSRVGTILSAADTLRVMVRCAGGHGSAPHRAKDPIPAACEMVTALSTFVTRRFAATG
jgi:hippurate hydrolase